MLPERVIPVQTGIHSPVTPAMLVVMRKLVTTTSMEEGPFKTRLTHRGEMCGNVFA